MVNNNIDTEDSVDLTGYNLFSLARKDAAGGGVGIYVRNDFSASIKVDMSLSTNFIECLFVEVCQINVPNILIGSVYRLPGTDVNAFNTALVSISSKLSIIGNLKSKHTIIAGDSNLDLLKAE